ncbi:MAG: hypothetical protein ABSG36_03050 [Acidimicrobiales bacterium]
MSRPLRFEGKTMEAARNRARERLGADVSELNILRHGRELSGGLFGFFQRERFVIEVADPATARPGVLGAPKVATPDPVVATNRLAALLEGTTDTVGVSFDRELRGVLEDAEAVVCDAASSSVISSYADPECYRASVANCGQPAQISFGTAEPSSTEFRDRLAACGLAEAYLPDPLFSEPALALPLRLGTIAPPAPVLRCEGEVLVLAGDIEESLGVSRQLGRKLDQEDAVLVVSHRRLPPSLTQARARTPLEAGTMVLERRIEGLASIVVLDTSCRAGFVPRTVAGLRPEAIWGIVPAAWDERRTREFQALVGRLDALALYGLCSTDHPAGLIGRGWPIAYVDGWEATPLSLAARLVEAVDSARFGESAGLCVGTRVAGTGM